MTYHIVKINIIKTFAVSHQILLFCSIEVKYAEIYVSRLLDPDWATKLIFILPGHKRRLQVSVSVWFPVHGLPPSMGAGSVQVRVRDHVPLSHDVLQVLQEDQVAHWPSTVIYNVNSPMDFHK